MNFIWFQEFSVNVQRPLQVNDGPLEGRESRQGISVSTPPTHAPVDTLALATPFKREGVITFCLQEYRGGEGR